ISRLLGQVGISRYCLLDTLSETSPFLSAMFQLIFKRRIPSSSHRKRIHVFRPLRKEQVLRLTVSVARRSRRCGGAPSPDYIGLKGPEPRGGRLVIRSQAAREGASRLDRRRDKGRKQRGKKRVQGGGSHRGKSPPRPATRA